MSEKKMYAGCTVVAALMRWEEVKDEKDGKASQKVSFELKIDFYLIYLLQRRLYVANAGDARAVLW